MGLYPFSDALTPNFVNTSLACTEDCYHTEHCIHTNGALRKIHINLPIYDALVRECVREYMRACVRACKMLSPILCAYTA